MAKKEMYNGIVLNGCKYESVEVPEECASVCENCDLEEFCMSNKLDLCDLFPGYTNFRYLED